MLHQDSWYNIFTRSGARLPLNRKGIAKMTTVNTAAKKVQAPKRVTKTMTVRVDPEVHAQFKAMSKMNGVPMQKTMEDFVNSYVAENWDPDVYSLEEESSENADD